MPSLAWPSDFGLLLWAAPVSAHDRGQRGVIIGFSLN